MAFCIAVAGKGGTGKTTFAALVVEVLRGCGLGPILAVDADPNATLGTQLGIHCHCTVSDILEETKGLRNLPPGVAKTTHLEYQLQRVVVEGRGVDLLVMGQPEGPDCYCTANHILRSYMDELTKNYKYLVIDNQAGMEHLNRRTTQNIDALFIISDPTRLGLRTARRIKDLIDKLGFLSIKDRYLVLNKVTEHTTGLQQEIKEVGVSLIGELPFTKDLPELDMLERPLASLSDKAGLFQACRDILSKTCPNMASK